MRIVAMLLLLPLAGTAACDVPTEPAALAASLAGEPSLVPITDQTTFGAVPGTLDLICTPVQYGAGPPREFEGVGNMTHLGRTTTRLTFVACALDLTGASVFSATAQLVTTAANGDELWGTGTMTQYANGDFVVHSVEFTGGTGRFALATGSAAGSGWISRGASGTYQGYWTLTGTISRPGE